MPTYVADERFWREYDALRPELRAAFRRALREFIGALEHWEKSGYVGLPRFPGRLRVKKMAGQQDKTGR